MSFNIGPLTHHHIYLSNESLTNQVLHQAQMWCNFPLLLSNVQPSEYLYPIHSRVTIGIWCKLSYPIIDWTNEPAAGIHMLCRGKEKIWGRGGKGVFSLHFDSISYIGCWKMTAPMPMPKEERGEHRKWRHIETVKLCESASDSKGNIQMRCEHPTPPPS